MSKTATNPATETLTEWAYLHALVLPTEETRRADPLANPEETAGERNTRHANAVREVWGGRRQRLTNDRPLR